MLSGPLTDNLKARLAIFSRTQDEGIIFNPIVGETQNKKDSLGVRLKTAYATDAFAFNMALTYEKQDGICCGRVYTGIEPDALSVLLPRSRFRGLKRTMSQ